MNLLKNTQRQKLKITKNNIKNKLTKYPNFKNIKVINRGIIIQIGEIQIKCFEKTIAVNISGITKNK